MKLFSQRDVSSCPAIVKAISRRECFQHIPDTTSLFILDFFYASCFSLRLKCTRDLLAKKSQKISFISLDMSTPGIPVEMKRNHDLICLKRHRSNPKAPTKLVCHIEGFKFMQQFSGRDSSSLRIGRDLLILAGKSHLRFLLISGKKIFKDAEFN